MNRLAVSVTLSACIALGFFTAAPVAAGDAGAGAGSGQSARSVDPCKLVKKREARTILGARIVEVERERDDRTGARACEWISNAYDNEDFEDRDAPYSLELSWQPMTDEVRQTLDDKDDLEPIPDLGDEAYLDQFDVIVIRGDDVLVAETHNWAGAITPQTDRAQEAARIALDRLPQG